ncbi:DNA cytosine methyltransferase [Bacillus pumilus]|uniref:DNA cytosine methyltransferase n=1 Tax=Bacillus pumilus TaxID=1408 RepID=UPI0010BE83AC|nr:DNA cytosine methyltransferase [Bacillus pumilus]TKI24127.1 DNA cytosine methyltransferase [Bacillus pumilus]
MKKFKVVSLFCGAGGLDLGLEATGKFQTVFANDMDKDACKTFSKWSDAIVVPGKVENISADEIPDDIDIVTGGFPCQGFSAAGPRQALDVRNKLYLELCRVVEAKQPIGFLAENVKGLTTMEDGLILKKIVEDFSSKGYNLYHQVLNAADYQVPQDRERVILVGIRQDIDKGFEFPEPTGRVTLREAIGHFPEPNSNDVCQDPYSSRYMSRNRKRDWDQVSYTIPAMAKQVTLHPSSPDMTKLERDLWKFGEGTTRRFSWQEAAVVQTFPESLVFEGDLTSKYKQIGNAVPPKLAEAVGYKFAEALEKALVREKTKVVI